MKLIKRRMLAVILSLVLVVGFLPVMNVRAEGGDKEVVNDEEPSNPVDYRAMLRTLIEQATRYYESIKNSEAYKNVAEGLKQVIDRAKEIINTDSISADVIAQIYKELSERYAKAVSDVEKIKEDIKNKAEEAWEKAKEEINKKYEEFNKVSEETWEKAKEEVARRSYSEEWRKGKWYNADHTQTYESTGSWKSDSTGWWYEDTSGWYAKSEWQKIDGKWYYFCADGYMDYSEYRDGCWLGADGAWDEDYTGGQWKSDATGWWYEDESGWYPTSQWVWIDGVCYYFNASGYME